jgi:RNA polymerase sigma-70 factor (ECF subfamily)
MSITKEKSAEWETRARTMIESIKNSKNENEKSTMYIRLREHCRTLTYYIIKGVAYQPPITREELKQLADIELWKCAMEYDPGKSSKFSTFYVCVLKNRAYDYVKGNQIPKQNIHMDDYELDETLPGENDTYDFGDYNENPALEYAMKQLTNKEKTFIAQLDKHDYNATELAEELNVSPQAIRRRRARLFEKIKERMNEYEQ